MKITIKTDTEQDQHRVYRVTKVLIGDRVAAKIVREQCSLVEWEKILKRVTETPEVGSEIKISQSQSD